MPLEPTLHGFPVRSLDVRFGLGRFVIPFVLDDLPDGAGHQRHEGKVQHREEGSITVPLGHLGRLQMAVRLQPPHRQDPPNGGGQSGEGDDGTPALNERLPVTGERFAGNAGLCLEEGAEDWILEEGQPDGRARGAQGQDEAKVGAMRLDTCRHCGGLGEEKLGGCLYICFCNPAGSCTGRLRDELRGNGSGGRDGASPRWLGVGSAKSYRSFEGIVLVAQESKRCTV